MEADKLQEHILKFFNSNERQIVFWYGVDEENENKLLSLKLDKIKIHKLTKSNNLLTKKLLESDDLTSNYLVYANFEKPEPKENWFIDTQFYSKEFSVDEVANLCSEFDIYDIAVKNLFKKHLKFFNNRERINKLKSLLPSSKTPEYFYIAMFATLVKGKLFDMNKVIQRFIIESIVKGNDLNKEFAKYDLVDKFWELVEKQFGYKGKRDAKLLLASIIFRKLKQQLSGANFPETYKKYTCANTSEVECNLFLESWYRDTELMPYYKEIAKIIEDKFYINPEMLSRRNKFLQLVRLIPFCERNYNLVELGPKGTGKSHIYTEFSPHGTLISGGEVTAAKLFVNNARRGNIGLVGYWDNIAFDEFAGSTKKADKALVDIMKGYMANQSFSRGVETLNAEASMTFIGNTKHNVPYMLKNSNLFEELPSQYLDSAFLDRLHFYIPGWEIDVIRNELFSDGYGFVVDYYAEALKTLRSYDYSNEYKQAVELSSDISTRDRDGIRKTFSGLMKIIYPHKKATNEEIEEILKFAMEGRKRVKDQILRIDATLPAVDFSYTKKSGEKVKIKTLEEIQYKNLYYQGRYSDDDIEGTITNTTLDVVKQKTMQISENNIHKESDLKEQHIEIEENQTGITYEKLFGDYIKNANKIVITDPYIRNFYQTLNLMELIELIEQKKSEADVVEVELITSRDELNSIQQEENLATIRESCFQLGIEFSYSFDETIHARISIGSSGMMKFLNGIISNKSGCSTSNKWIKHNAIFRTSCFYWDFN